MPPFTPTVEALPGELPFTAPERLERQWGAPPLLRLGANESVFGVAPGVLEAMAEALREVAWYGDPESLALREEIARRHGLGMEEVSVGAGIDDLLGLAVRVFLRPGDVGVGARGGYPMFPFHVAAYGGVVADVPYRDDRSDLEALAELAHRRRARLVYLANPDNPSGSFSTGAEVAAFRAALPEDAVLLLDQAYLELAPPEAAVDLDVGDGRLIAFRTFSKAWGMAGARIGYAFAAAEVVRAFDKVRAHFNVNRVAQAGALASLRSEGFLERVREGVATGRRDLAEVAAELGLGVLPSATNFVLMDFATAERATAVLEALLGRRVFLRKPLVPPLDRCLRVSIGSPDERRQFAELLHGLRRDGVF